MSSQKKRSNDYSPSELRAIHAFGRGGDLAALLDRTRTRNDRSRQYQLTKLGYTRFVFITKASIYIMLKRDRKIDPQYDAVYKAMEPLQRVTAEDIRTRFPMYSDKDLDKILKRLVDSKKRMQQKEERQRTLQGTTMVGDDGLEEIE